MARIRPARPDDIPALDRALRALSRHMDDPHLVEARELQAALFGPRPVAHAGIADGAAELRGTVLFAPCFSTVRGGPGAFVSDLWVAPDARQEGLGAALLGFAARAGRAEWGARFLRLMVYDTNVEARAFYARAGFRAAEDEIVLTLSGAAFDDLEETA